jgi:hypothetical protein
MKQQGITYFDAMPQPIADCWTFWCCENLPNPLPKGLSLSKRRPYDFVNKGLSRKRYHQIKEQLIKIRKGKKAHGITKGGAA